MIRPSPQNQKGFTLIEILVSVAIFTIVMVISLGAIFTIINADKKAQSIKSVMDNLDSALENMTRTIKTGSDYVLDPLGYSADGDVRACDGSQLDQSNVLQVGSAIINGVNGDTVTYALGSVVDNAYDSSGSQIIKIVDDHVDPIQVNAVTAPEVTIERMCFYVSGNNVNGPDNKQPEIIMILEGYAGTEKTQTHFNLQSTISQRLLDS